MSELMIARRAIAYLGRRLEHFTIMWNFLEGLIAISAGVVAGSISLVAPEVFPVWRPDAASIQTP
jgi:hypothetical protein